MRDLLQKIFFHGSERHSLTELDPIHSDAIRPFGKAVYLSLEKATAKRYARFQGSIYQVQLNGNPAMTINLDATFRDQGIEAREAIRPIIKANNPNFDVHTSQNDVRELIGGNKRDTRVRMTEQLLEAGIWMIYGTVGPDEHSGDMDDGIQYAILDREHLLILSEERCE